MFTGFCYIHLTSIKLHGVTYQILFFIYSPIKPLFLIPKPLFIISFPPCEIFLYSKYVSLMRQKCHNSKFVIFQEKFLNVSKCYNFLWLQRQHNCSLAASFANCVMTLHLLKVRLQTFLSIPKTQKCQILIPTFTQCIQLVSCLHTTAASTSRLTPDAALFSLSPDDGHNYARNMLS